ncbi:hypothetical protein [Nocardioides mangrovi]|uniref:Proteinase inhibitor I42 chagasin domain-containing protein n=1 Tax=Nocardioides mangrovi TaxID=2874580 RepID=A0ABS7UIL1_9ACTN|nr:hypothetical protein [Nocardioides mangrovi]MBZ5740640.1 hypothetical protein [Nocardioides mangrovi]
MSMPQIHVVEDPAAGQVVQLAAGSALQVRFRRRFGGGTWEVSGRPDHLVPLAEGTHELTFLVFSGPGEGHEAPLRLVRRRTAQADPCEVRELRVVLAG